MTITQEKIESLRSLLFQGGKEGAAYLFCKKSQTRNEQRLLVYEIMFVNDEHYLTRSTDRLCIDSLSYTAAAKRAAMFGFHIIFIHSHISGAAKFSDQDNQEDPKLMDFFQSRIRNKIVGSAIITMDNIVCRAWLNREWHAMDKIRIAGERYKIITNNEVLNTTNDSFDRQILVFGHEGQKQLESLHIGIVGAGGTGSSVAEQITRLGVGEISIWDGDKFEASNINRVYGSKVSDAGRNKAKILGAHLKRVGLKETRINIHPDFITVINAAKKLRECDVIFCCTDNEASRGILMRVGIYYLIPVIDTAVTITSNSGAIVDLIGRTTILTPGGGSCLFCRERIDPQIITAETMDKGARDRLVKEGYIRDLDIKNPSVITFTTIVAAHAVGELLNQMYNYKVGKKSTETLFLFNWDEIKKTTIAPKSCICQLEDRWGKGDSKNGYLDLIWPA
ncbi:MAG: ThiF family adenylyltransferase [Candidatus Magasanikbacteria bacterium]